MKTPTVPRKPLKIITPEQFDAIYATIPDATLRLLVETDIESGLRWGELTELRVNDIDLISAFSNAHQEIVRFDISMNERFCMNVFNTSNKLLCQ